MQPRHIRRHIRVILRWHRVCGGPVGGRRACCTAPGLGTTLITGDCGVQLLERQVHHCGSSRDSASMPMIPWEVRPSTKPAGALTRACRRRRLPRAQSWGRAAGIAAPGACPCRLRLLQRSGWGMQRAGVLTGLVLCRGGDWAATAVKWLDNSNCADMQCVPYGLLAPGPGDLGHI